MDLGSSWLWQLSNARADKAAFHGCNMATSVSVIISAFNRRIKNRVTGPCLVPEGVEKVTI